MLASLLFSLLCVCILIKRHHINDSFIRALFTFPAGMCSNSPGCFSIRLLVGRMERQKQGGEIKASCVDGTAGKEKQQAKPQVGSPANPCQNP